MISEYSPNCIPSIYKYTFSDCIKLISACLLAVHVVCSVINYS